MPDAAPEDMLFTAPEAEMPEMPEVEAPKPGKKAPKAPKEPKADPAIDEAVAVAMSRDPALVEADALAAVAKGYLRYYKRRPA